MVDFVLNDLGSPAGKGFQACLEIFILILYFDGFPALCLSRTCKGKTALLGLIQSGLLYDLRIEHGHVAAFAFKYDDAFAYANHIACHADAALLVGLQRLQQVCRQRKILWCGGFGLLGKQGNISANFSYHCISSNNRTHKLVWI